MKVTDEIEVKIRKAAFEIAKATDEAAAIGCRRFMFEEYITEVSQIIVRNLEGA